MLDRLSPPSQVGTLAPLDTAQTGALFQPARLRTHVFRCGAPWRTQPQTITSARNATRSCVTAALPLTGTAPARARPPPRAPPSSPPPSHVFGRKLSQCVHHPALLFCPLAPRAARAGATAPASCGASGSPLRACCRSGAAAAATAAGSPPAPRPLPQGPRAGGGRGPLALRPWARPCPSPCRGRLRPSEPPWLLASLPSKPTAGGAAGRAGGAA
jgi:hypothetical protein